jgi:hypothetical protein
VEEMIVEVIGLWVLIQLLLKYFVIVAFFAACITLVWFAFFDDGRFDD